MLVFLGKFYVRTTRMIPPYFLLSQFSLNFNSSLNASFLPIHFKFSIDFTPTVCILLTKYEVH